LHALLVCFPGKVAEPPREEPLEHEGHDETNCDDANDEYEGEVQDDLGGDASNAVCVDEANGDDVLQTVPDATLVSACELHRNVLAVECAVWRHHLVEEGRVIYLSFAQPLQETEIKDRPIFKNARSGGICV